MSVLLIHQAFVSPREAGGTRHYEFAQYCLNEGVDFSIVASDLSYLSGEKVTTASSWVEVQDLDGLKVLRSYTYPALHKSFAWRVVSFLSFMATSVLAGLKAGPIDIVMGTSPPIFQAFSAWLVSFIRRKKLLLEVRDLWPEFAIDMGVLTNPLIIRLARRLETFLYRRAAHIIVNSPAYRDYLIDRHQIKREKVTMIPNGVDPTMFDPAAKGESIRQQFELADKIVVTYAGALGQANDISTILRAAERLRNQSNIHFLLVGDGKERSNLEKEAQSRSLKNVTFTGTFPKSRIGEVLAASDICTATLMAIPMFKTTYPNKVFDYMAAGRPTVLGIDGVIREVVEAGDAGLFVEPGDDAALAEAILDLANSPELREKMGRSGRDYVTAHFNRAAHSHAFVKLVQELIDG